CKRPPLRGPEARDAANADADLLKLGRTGHHSEIGGEVERVGTADNVAVDAVDHRLRAMNHFPEHALERAFIGAHADHVVAVFLVIIADVAAGREETAAGGRDHDTTDTGPLAGADQRIDDLVQRLAPERIAALLAVDCDPGSVAALHKGDVLVGDIKGPIIL